MSTEPRLPPVSADLPTEFGTVMAHAPEIIARFGALYAQLWQHGRVPPDLRELTRLRNARVTDCGY